MPRGKRSVEGLAAAKIRCLTLRDYLRQAAISLSDEDLAARRRFSADPFERRPVASYPISRPR